MRAMKSLHAFAVESILGNWATRPVYTGVSLYYVKLAVLEVW